MTELGHKFYSVWAFSKERTDYQCIGITSSWAEATELEQKHDAKAVEHPTFESLVDFLLKGRLGVLADSLLRLELLACGTMPGLPKPGEPGQFIGFSAEGSAYVLKWQEDQAAWFGVGFMSDLYKSPHAVLAKEDKAEFFKSHAKIAAA